MAGPAAATEPPPPKPVRHTAVSHSAQVSHHAAVSHHAVASHHAAVSHHAVIAAGHARTVTVAWHPRHASAVRHFVRRGGISCVPFAREDSGIQLTGNAWQWWGHAAGVYARGQVPEVGAVLAFRANPRMRLGHVAVVSQVINPREVEIDHANWWGPGSRGGISHNVPVVDVSEANDWSAVRVGLGRSGEFGAVYPTYGFIYGRPDNGVRVAAASAPAPEPVLNPAPRDLRPVAERPWHTYEEVAQAPDPSPVRPVASAYHWQPGAVGAIDPK